MTTLRRPRTRRLAWTALGVFSVGCGALACGTLATAAGDDDATRPNATSGPFRAISDAELPDSNEAPNVLSGGGDDNDSEESNDRWYRQASAVSLDASKLPGSTALYVVVGPAGQGAIHRYHADDARTFDDELGDVVLEAELSWEGDGLTEPSVHPVGDEMWLYYGAEGGIGFARSSDGVTFTRESKPVLEAGGADWEAGAVPQAPAFLPLPAEAGGGYRLFYEANGRIGEAESEDGVTWTRIGTAPILEPSAGTFDAAGVGAPFASRWQSPEGRWVTRIYYAGVDAEGASSIGLAARFGNDGGLTKAVARVFSGFRSPGSPTVIASPSLSLMYVTQRAGVTSALTTPAIALTLAPSTAKLGN